MSQSVTLMRYLISVSARNLLLMLGGFLMLVYLFDTVELIRRASKYTDVPFGLVLQMGVLKLPEVGQILFPFTILFSVMFSLWQLNRSQQLVAIRAAGYSIWQILTPFVILALGVGFLQMSLINPLSTLLLSQFEQLEAKYLDRKTSQITMLQGEIWLRQPGEGDGYVIMNARSFNYKAFRFEGVHLWSFAADDTPEDRMDAVSASLKDGFWVFEDVAINRPLESVQIAAQITMPTNLTLEDVENSFASPETLSFWRLPSHIRMLEQTGFNTARLRVHYYTLLAQPLMFVAMVLLAACVSLRPPRQNGGLALVSAGIAIGFLIFFASSFLQAFGASGQIPALVASWVPALVSFLLGVTVLLNLEEG